VSETRIRALDGMVTYTLPADIANSLAEVLEHEATHYRRGDRRPIAKTDRGWLGDAMRLAEVADALLALETD
jgi:hypothetical protein